MSLKENWGKYRQVQVNKTDPPPIPNKKGEVDP